MSKVTDLAQTIGLEATESTVFSSLLAGGRQNVARLTRACGEPRSTVIDTLARLQKRGLVRPVPIGKHTEWKVTNAITLAEKFLRVAELLQAPADTGTQEKHLHLQLSRESEFTIFVGWRNMIAIYKREMIAHANQRLLAMQSASSIKTALEKAGSDDFIPVNDAIREHKVIIEAVIGEGMLKWYTEQDPNWVKSLEGRTIAYRVVEDELLDFTAELLIFNNLFLLVNWQEEVLILIKNQQMLNMMKKLHTLMYEAGHPFDQNEYLRKVLENRK